jgi:tRNA (guanine-N7-)-methyltransferase
MLRDCTAAQPAPIGRVELNAALTPALLPGASSGDSTRSLHSPANAGLAGRRPNSARELPQQAAGNASAFKPDFVELLSRRRAALRAELGAVLPQPRPIVLELGCGHGHFLERYAREFPSRFCLGVDLRSDRIARARRKAHRAGHLNCHFIRAEAGDFLIALPSGVTFEEIWVLFPDPWPKKRHHKNRLLQPEFFEAVAGWTVSGARLYFRTDYGEYFREVESFLPSLQTWQPAPAAAWPIEPETVFQSRAASYHSLVAIRTSHPARPVETVAPELPPPTNPTSAA